LTGKWQLPGRNHSKETSTAPSVRGVTKAKTELSENDNSVFEPKHNTQKEIAKAAVGFNRARLHEITPAPFDTGRKV
jgi:hypothetical protein